MDQAKIGSFLKELRKERSLTQEQLAEKFGVSGRTVSRWENGNNMPDISILVELAEFYGTDIREILAGERSEETAMDEEMKDTLVKVAEYTDAEKEKILKSLLNGIITGACAFLFLFVMLMFNATVGLKDKADIGASAFIAWIGLSVMTGSIISVMQIKGNMTKNRMTKLRKIGIPLCICLMIVCAFTIAVFTTSLFRSEELARDTTDTADYGDWYGLLSHTNLYVFPQEIPEGASDVEYSFYNDDSLLGESSLVYLKCRYDDDELEREIARLKSIDGIRKDTENYNGTAYVTMLLKYETEYALVTDDNSIVYLCIHEGRNPRTAYTAYLRKNTAAESDLFSVYDFSDYDDYKYWPQTWK
ncbi:MAG: helix-turn-helix transcriptional regulator [Oscillospiraceae bacterium]|nr:helix-turn-helix transcriptional regulator [Oscillospiraceae bacterium]